MLVNAAHELPYKHKTQDAQKTAEEAVTQVKALGVVVALFLPIKMVRLALRG